MAQDTPPGGLRIGHAERDRTIELLREHTAAGRLDLDEFEERVEHVTRARVTADLDAVLIDLPQLSAPPNSAAPPADVPAWSPPRPLWGPARPLPRWVLISVLMIGIWAVAGFGYFWPVWVIVPMAFGALRGGCGRRVGGHRPRHDHISA